MIHPNMRAFAVLTRRETSPSADTRQDYQSSTAGLLGGILGGAHDKIEASKGTREHAEEHWRSLVIFTRTLIAL